MPWLSDDAIVRIASNYEGAAAIADDPDAISYRGIVTRSTFQQAWPMSVHSKMYVVKSRGAKQATEDKVEVSIGAYFLKALDRDPTCIL